jgi:hypothetical protein
LLTGRGGRLGTAAVRYREAIAELEPTGESMQLASLWGLYGEVQKLLGNPLDAWDARVGALRGMGVRGTDVQVHQVLYEAASAARSEGRLAAALHLHAGVRSRARRTGVPEFIAEALIRTGELQVQLDRLGDAVQSADSARKAAELITNSRVAAWIHADLARLAHSVRSHPGAPNPLSILNVLDSAIATQRGLGHEHLLLNLLVERGRTLASLGREEARADVDAALALVGQVAASSLDSREQARFAEAMRSVGEIAALMTAQGQVSAPWGLSVLEEIASMAWGSPSGPTVSSASPLPLSVPEDRAVVRYAVLEEEAFVWLLVGEDLHRVRLPVPVGELSRLTGELRGAGERGLSLSDLSSPARDLAEQILPPQVMEWVGQRDLVFVPDGPLVGVPFSILPGPDGEMLLRHRAVAVAPSVAWAIAPGRHMPGWGSGAQVVLAGNALPTDGLPSLSGAREEVETLRDRYPDALVLADSSATPAALQSSDPGGRSPPLRGSRRLRPDPDGWVLPGALSRPPGRPRVGTLSADRCFRGRSPEWSFSLPAPVWPRTEPSPEEASGGSPSLFSGVGACRSSEPCGPFRIRRRLPSRNSCTRNSALGLGRELPFGRPSSGLWKAGSCHRARGPRSSLWGQGCETSGKLSV